MVLLYRLASSIKYRQSSHFLATWQAKKCENLLDEDAVRAAAQEPEVLASPAANSAQGHEQRQHCDSARTGKGTKE